MMEKKETIREPQESESRTQGLQTQKLQEERLELVLARVRRIPQEHFGAASFEEYFAAVAQFLLLLEETRAFLERGGLGTASLEELTARNHALYEDIMPIHYEESYANPAYAVKRLGDEFGAMLSFLYVEMRSLIGFVYEGRMEEILIRLELFAEIYTAFVYEWQENHRLPLYEDIRGILYWFVSDYADMAAENRTRELLTSEDNFAAGIIRAGDLSDVRYLFSYGEYVGDNEIETARFLAKLPQETINLMADTYTEGYRIGFEATGKDLSKKKTVEIRYRLGFERMIKKAVENFAELGLRPSIYRAAYSILYNPTLYKAGFFGGEVNRQCDYDHKDDRALFLDKNYVNRKLQVSRTAFEKYKKEALEYAGPAVVETFGEKEFEPVNKPECISMSGEQNRLWVEYRSRAGEIQREYILEEERSFTIIAFPVPEIGDFFPELFQEVIQINTLDYRLYRDIQQKIINALDTADHCEIKGMKDNRTSLVVKLYELKDPQRETIFENCMADVNIPVGEVFTSPVLAGTNGVLHVTRVFLNGLEYKNLELIFRDGMIQDYSCSNFEKPEESRAFIKENILFRHKSLPIGEFAIGTNTAAYVTARKYGIEDKLPILIAEKTGPHFAVGDTCYSHAEEIKVYNPDGKEIVARDNELSRLRDKNPAGAYFNCHTDITIPYDELGELTAVRKDGTRIPIIKEGRFVLPGTEALNRPLDQAAQSDR